MKIPSGMRWVDPVLLLVFPVFVIHTTVANAGPLFEASDGS